MSIFQFLGLTLWIRPSGFRRGIRFSFDIYSDVDYSRLNKGIINEFLEKYKNPVFIDFARSLTNVCDNHS